MLFINETILFQEPVIYLLMLGVAIGVGLVIFKKIKTDSKTDFKPQSLSEVVINENFKPFVKEFGTKLTKGVLYTPHKKIPLRKRAEIRLKYTIKEKDKKGVIVDVDKEGKFIIFRTGKTIFSELPVLNRLVKGAEYILINDEDRVLLKDKMHDSWTTTDNVFFYRFAGMWICSKETQIFITEMIYKKMLENTKEEDMNYIKRIVFYNDQYAQKIGVMEQDYQLEKDKWKDKVESETGVKRK